MSVLSTIGEHISKGTKFIEIFKVISPNLPENSCLFVLLFFLEKKLNKSFMSIISNEGEKISDIQMLYKYLEDHVLKFQNNFINSFYAIL